MFEHAAKLNFEGIVSKNAQAPYPSDRNEAWPKIKTVQESLSGTALRPPDLQWPPWNKFF
jgi:ATP-dependent DNA ligase